MHIKPFKAIRPHASMVAQVASVPYDYNREDVYATAVTNLLNFLGVKRAEEEDQFDDDVDAYALEVLSSARAILEAQEVDGNYVQEATPCYYVCEQICNGRSQTGLAACCSIDDYIEGNIKKHENTLAAKEEGCVRNINALDAQTGPIFLTYRNSAIINALIDRVRANKPLYDFSSGDDVRHRIWRVADSETIKHFTDAFSTVPAAYIADGHHRSSSAVRVGLDRRKKNPDYTGEEEYNFFVSIIYPDEQLSVYPYNRVVRDLNGLTKDEFLKAIEERFTILGTQPGPYEPEVKGEFGMYLDGLWYELDTKPSLRSDHPLDGLDVSILQDKVLNPILGIEDPRTDARLEFISGVEGLEALERRANHYTEGDSYGVAFSMFSVSIQELIDVADEGLLMPPKATWFEPKPRNGLLIHTLK